MSEGKFNYEWLANNINALYGEGYSKYTQTERKEVDKLKEMSFNILKYCNPHTKIIQEGYGNKKIAYKLNKENYYMLMDVLEKFERLVKDYNDDHGLTTKNKGHGGLF